MTTMCKALLLTVWLSLAIGTNTFAETLTWDFFINEQSVKNGPEADGSTNSPGFGHGFVTLDLETNVMSYEFSWSDLVGDLTKLHIHGPASEDMSNPQHIVEIFGPPEVPVELVGTSGSVSDSFELLTLEQEGFEPLSPDAIIETMINGQAYLNVHTTVFGTGEIRGNLGQPVPEPSARFSLLVGLAFFLRIRGKRRIASTND